MAGLGTRCHAVPFQCRIRVVPLPDEHLPAQPTAHALRADRAVTRPGRRAGLGLGTRFQVLPFHRAIRVRPLAEKQLPAQPTAQALRAEAMATLEGSR